MDVSADEVRGAGQQQAQNSSEQFRAYKLLQFAFLIFEAFDNSRYTKTTLFNHLLIITVQYILEDRHDVSNCRERVFRDITAAICSSSDGCPLGTCCKKVEIG